MRPRVVQGTPRLAALEQLQPDSLTWKRGMAEWTPAGQIDALFPVRPESPAQPAVQSADLWYYDDDEQRHGPISLDELRQLACSEQLYPDDLVWTMGMPDWIPAEQVEGLFPEQPEPPELDAAIHQLPQEPSDPEFPSPTFQERAQGSAIPPHLTWPVPRRRPAHNWERLRKFVRRQHLGTRLRLLIAATARGAVWCYNAARPHVVRAWNKRPSKQQIRDWSAAKSRANLGSLEADGTLERSARTTSFGCVARGAARTCLVPENLWGLLAWPSRKVRNLGAELA